jgi:hypothetical protein
VYQILNVPNCTFIEIHRGNVDADSDGCVLLGEQMVRGPGLTPNEMVTNSRITFENFMAFQDNAPTFPLLVSTPPAMITAAMQGQVQT